MSTLKGNLIICLSAVTAVLVAGCGTDSSETGAEAESNDEGASGAPLVVSQVEAYNFETLEDMAATADVVVHGTVVDTEDGIVVYGDESSEPDPPAPEDRRGTGYSRITLDIAQSFKGADTESQLTLLHQSYQPDSGRPVVIEGYMDIEVGQEAIWFLNETGVDQVPDDYFQMSSAGRMVRNMDGTTQVDGRNPIAADMCGVAWEELIELVSSAVEQSTQLDANAAAEPSDEVAANNPCLQSADDRLD